MFRSGLQIPALTPVNISPIFEIAYLLLPEGDLSVQPVAGGYEEVDPVLQLVDIRRDPVRQQEMVVVANVVRAGKLDEGDQHLHEPSLPQMLLNDSRLDVKVMQGIRLDPLVLLVPAEHCVSVALTVIHQTALS